MPRLRFPLAGALLLAAFASTAPSQGCTSGTFWKRDTLPDVPTGLTGVSVIQGMCEGESAGVVFTMPANMPVQRITQVVAPWGAAGGVNGFQALLDVEVYDGVSFSGANVNMGTRVFSLTQDLSANMQVTSHSFNTLDTSTYNIVVGAQPPVGGVRRFAVCFRCDFNGHPSGSCATGWQANFFTDNSQQPTFPFTCNPAITPPQTSIMEIQGQGWRDTASATVTGIPICPIYYSGVFCIRCCTEDAFPAYYTTFGQGCANSLGVSQIIPATQPRIGTNLFVIVDKLPYNLGLMVTGASNTFSAFGPLPLDVSALGLPGCNLRVSLDFTDGLIGGGTSASYLLAIPNQSALLGARLYQQAFVVDPPLNPFGGALSNAAEMQIGN